MSKPDPWLTLDLTRPSYSLRCHARGLAPVTDPKRAAALGLEVGELAPALTLPEAAALLGMRGATSAHTAEQRERRGELGTVAKLLERAAAYGLEVEVRVRRRT